MTSSSPEDRPLPMHSASSSEIAEYQVPASVVVDELRKFGVTDVVTVPDWVQMATHALLLARSDELRSVRCATEDEAVVVAAGLYAGGRRPVVMIQNQGLVACLNNLRAMGLDAQIPIPMLVGQFGREFSNLGHDASESGRRMVRILEPMLEILEIPYRRLEYATDAHMIEDVLSISYDRSCPAVAIFGANTAWDWDDGRWSN